MFRTRVYTPRCTRIAQCVTKYKLSSVSNQCSHICTRLWLNVLTDNQDKWSREARYLFKQHAASAAATTNIKKDKNCICTQANEQGSHSLWCQQNSSLERKKWGIVLMTCPVTVSREAALNVSQTSSKGWPEDEACKAPHLQGSCIQAWKKQRALGTTARSRISSSQSPDTSAGLKRQQPCAAAEHT